MPLPPSQKLQQGKIIEIVILDDQSILDSQSVKIKKEIPADEYFVYV